MSSEEASSLEHVGSDMAKAFQELAKGEKTASILESRLTNIESRIDQLLATMEETDKDKNDSPAAESAESEVVTPSRR